MSQTSNPSQPLSQETFDSLWKQIEIKDNSKDCTYTNLYSEEYEEVEVPITCHSEMDRQVEVKLDHFQVSNEMKDQTLNIAPNGEIDYEVRSVSSAVPSLTDYTGFYGFFVEPEAGSSNAKSTAYTYAKTLNKLFVKDGISIPFKFSTKKSPPLGSVIRTMALYKKPEHILDVVQRCENHKKNDIFSDEAPHFIRSENRLASYHNDNHGRYSVSLPFEYPQAGTTYCEQLYKFMCLSSCPPNSINRRPLYIVFTLEDKMGNILGRQKTELKVCSCPGRDKRSEENNDKKKVKLAPNKQLTLTTFCGQKRKAEEEDKEFFLSIKGRENYEILKRVKQALELKKYVPASALSQYMKEEAKSQVVSSQQSCDEPDCHSVVSNQPTAENDHSLSRWLTKVACNNCIDAFSSNGFTHVNDLENITYQDIDIMRITQRMKIKVWKAILDYKSDLSVNVSNFPKVSKTNCDLSPDDSQKNGLTLTATRLVVKDKMTFKQVK